MMSPDEDLDMRRIRTCEIIDKLKDIYPDAECSLTYENPLQLLIATMLSAQCTDERVNMVTPVLFERYPTAMDFADAPLDELEGLIRSTGFFRNKARNIQGCCQALVDNHGGQVPRSMDELVALDGVGRKTANVVLGNAFGIAEGVVVDTHVRRISNRLGLTWRQDPVKIEQDLIGLVPKKEWVDLPHLFIHHGRAICSARAPDCDACGVGALCPSKGRA
ncbi:MAG: endonuclease III [Gemmatimonadetes bacterium]|nr:endonuclease III [Gemmatimonadota bacterium]